MCSNASTVLRSPQSWCDMSTTTAGAVHGAVYSTIGNVLRSLQGQCDVLYLRRMCTVTARVVLSRTTGACSTDPTSDARFPLALTSHTTPPQQQLELSPRTRQTTYRSCALPLLRCDASALAQAFCTLLDWCQSPPAELTFSVTACTDAMEDATDAGAARTAGLGHGRCCRDGAADTR